MAAKKKTGKKQSDKCSTKWCRNKKASKVTTYISKNTGKVRTYRSFLPICWKCKSKRLKQRHPVTYVLNALRQRAKQRGIPCNITLEEFKTFCKHTGYIERRGHATGALTIDRIDHDKGYHIWNIQVLTFDENCRQGHVVPGKETQQNEPRPTSYNYDYDGPEPEEVVPASSGDPF